MDRAKRQKLDQILRGQRLKIGLRMVAVAALALLVMSFFIFDPARNGEILEGEVIGLWQPPMNRIYRPVRWVVAFDSGHRVNVGGLGDLPYERGRRVLVRERVGMIFGPVRYIFHGYAETAEGGG